MAAGVVYASRILPYLSSVVIQYERGNGRSHYDQNGLRPSAESICDELGKRLFTQRYSILRDVSSTGTYPSEGSASPVIRRFIEASLCSGNRISYTCINSITMYIYIE